MTPAEVDQLLEDLREEKAHSGVVAQADSQMVIVLEDGSARHVFNADECRFLLGSADTVQRLFEALDYPEDVFVELHDLVVEPEVMNELEDLASTVDEM